MAQNRQDLERALSTVTSELLKAKGYIAFVDVFQKLGYLSTSSTDPSGFPCEIVARRQATAAAQRSFLE